MGKLFSKITPRSNGPASVEVSIRKHIVIGSVLVAVLALGLGGWASTAEISGALIAPGSIVVDSNIKKVQHPTGGVVGEVRVHDGDRVKAGDILIRLDETVTRANLSIVTKGLNELYARKARLGAERDGADTMAVPRELAGNIDNPDVKDAMDSGSASVRPGAPPGSGRKISCRSASINFRSRLQGSSRSRRPYPRSSASSPRNSPACATFGKGIWSSSIGSPRSSATRPRSRASAAR